MEFNKMAKKFDLDAYKKSVVAAPVEKKPDKYVVLDECLQSVIGIPGVPLGHITQVYGKSDTGKTSLLFHAAAQAQKQNVLPVFIMTEGKVDWSRAEKMGVKVDQCIINEDCQTLEDVFAAIDRIVTDVGMGELPMDTLILWDSIGSLPSKDEVVINKDGTTDRKPSMMKAAKVIREHIRVLSKKINNTRNISFPKAVGLMALNQAYTKPPESAYGHSSLVPYGGDGVWYAASAVWQMKKIKRLSATKNKMAFDFALISRISVQKNHITDLMMEGDFVITSDAFIPNEKKAIDDYKDAHRDQWGESEIYEAETGEFLDS
jgi:RecA/RadA recombinase